MLEWRRIKAGNYESVDGRFVICLEPNTTDQWFLTDRNNLDGLYGHWTLKGCKEWAEDILNGKRK